MVIACAVTLTWLALGNSPTKARLDRINGLIASGKIGKVEPVLQKRLDQQFRWLAHYAGVREKVAVNEIIRPHQLTLIMTEPEYASITHCGSGNAIYDPSLQTIFVDHMLVWPTEVMAIGTESVNTMFTVNKVGYVVSYTNFLLAHELGHWQKHNRSSAFFHYGWNDGDGPAGYEVEADRSAIRTILAAYISADVPDSLKDLNAFPVLGLNEADFNPEERVAVDIAVAVLQLSDDLLFASSPYSPFHSDRNHPDMLARVQDALNQVLPSSLAVTLSAQTQLLQAQLDRYASLKQWRYRELFFPGPLTAADVRNDALWLGRTDIPKMDRESASKHLDEQIYRIPLKQLDIAQASGTPLDLQMPVAVGSSKVGEAYGYAENHGYWVEEKFKDGDASIGLSPQAPSLDPQREKDWGSSKWGGLQYIGMVWLWPARGATPAGRLTEREIAMGLKSLLPAGKTSLGVLQWAGDKLALPVAVIGSDQAMEMRVFELSFANSSWQYMEQREFRLTLPSGIPEVSASIFWRERWWTPVRFGVGSPGEHFELWQTANHRQQRFGTQPLLFGLGTKAQMANGLDHLKPSNPRLLPIHGPRALFGYDHDSLYLIDGARGKMHLIFHPTRWGLRVLDLGDGRVMFWMLHGRKAYLVDTTPGE